VYAIKTRFDGEKVIIPNELRGLPPGEVILIFADGTEQATERLAWTKAQESAFAKAWINDEDAVYDNL